MARKKITILHSNDLHGDFLPKITEDGESGGLSRLSGYIKKVRAEEKNVLYAGAGDMFRGSVIDSEYLGLSTIDLMNLMRPDVMAVGNHEVDYGLAHLLFLEKCARFPIINANLIVTMGNIRLFQPFLNIDIDGMRILFIGILTEEVIASTKSEKVIGTFVNVEEAAKEIGIICDNYRTRHTDMVVVLSHIGIEADRELAARLDPEWGVDIIIGGHSHTDMEAPEVINHVPIIQCTNGTGQIGRFDIEYDTFRNRILSLKWQKVLINEETAPRDEIMDQLLAQYKDRTDAKYRRVITTFARKLTHPARNQETEMGNLYADLLQWESSFDIMFMGSGAIRKKEMGPIVEYQDMLENTPFDDVLWMLKVNGEELRKMIMFVFRDEAWEEHTEFYQFSKGVHFRYRKSSHELEAFEFRGKPIENDQEFLIAMQNYHYTNFDEFFGISLEEVSRKMKPRIIATSVNNIVEEYFATHQNLDAQVEGRIEILE